MMSYHGVMVLEIIENGRILSSIGVTNYASPSRTIGTDIAKLISGTLEVNDKAIYDAVAMNDANTTLMECILTIELRQDNIYDLVWVDKKDNATIWIGIGLKAGNNRIAVSYSH